MKKILFAAVAVVVLVAGCEKTIKEASSSPIKQMPTASPAWPASA